MEEIRSHIASLATRPGEAEAHAGRASGRCEHRQLDDLLLDVRPARSFRWAFAVGYKDAQFNRQLSPRCVRRTRTARRLSRNYFQNYENTLMRIDSQRIKGLERQAHLSITNVRYAVLLSSVQRMRLPS